MTIERLRQAKAALEREGSAEAAWLVGVIAEYEAKAPEGLTLDRAAGLVPPPGQDSWWTVERRRKRDDAIRRLKAEQFGDLGITAAAREIAKAGNAYLTRGRHGNQIVRKPLLAEALETGVPFPGVRQIETILRNQT
jgi:hypothetical protein